MHRIATAGTSRGLAVMRVARTDEELMRDFQTGDRGALDELYHRYRTPIATFFTRNCCGQASLAQDLTQDVFVRVIRNAPTFRHGAKVSTWLFTIARNLFIDNVRKARHRAHRSLDQPTRDDGPRLDERIPGKAAEPDRETIAGRLRNELAEAIAGLPDEQREVFLLREYCGLPFAEIAQVVDAKEGTVKSRMRYALEALRRQLDDYADYARTLP